MQVSTQKNIDAQGHAKAKAVNQNKHLSHEVCRGVLVVEACWFP
jgi:hypothetical protein